MYLGYTVGLSGLEPPTSRLSGVRSNRLSYKPIIAILIRNVASNLTVCSGITHGYRGDKGIRTLDPLLARQVLSQLSYTPILIRQPPTLPCRLQHSTIGRPGLNHRVRDENGCLPRAYRHRKGLLLFFAALLSQLPGN